MLKKIRNALLYFVIGICGVFISADLHDKLPDQIIHLPKPLLKFSLIGIILLVVTKKVLHFNPKIPRNIALTLFISFLSYHLFLPGMTLHVWEKIQATELRTTIRFLNEYPKSPVYLWNATVLHGCDVNWSHDFILSEMLIHHGLDHVIFLPGPHYPFEKCLYYGKHYKDIWQTKFYPQNMLAYLNKSKKIPDLILVSPQQYPRLQEILKDLDFRYTVIFQTHSTMYWKPFFETIIRKTPIWRNDPPGYYLLGRIQKT